MLEEMKKIEIIEKIINEKSLDDNLLKSLKREFLSKKLNMLNIINVFQRNITFNSLMLNEQIAFIKGSFEYLKWANLNPAEWFNNKELNDYDGMIDIGDELLLSNVVKFKGFKKINDNQYLGSISVKDLALGLKNGFWSYNFDSQRKPTLIKVGNKSNDNYIKLPTVNKESVKEIKKLIKNNNYNFDEIKFNIRLMRDCEPDVEIISYSEYMDMNMPDELAEECSKFCDIIVRLNHEYGSKNRTLIDSIDGWHRSLATAEAVFEYYNETKEWLEGEFPVSLYMVDVETARDIVLQGFKRNDNLVNHKKNQSIIDNTDIFVDGLVKKVKLLRNRMTDSWEIAGRDNLIYRENFDKTIRALKIPLKNVSNRNFAIKDLSENLNLILDYIYENIFYKNKNRLDEIFQKNIFCIYLSVAWLTRNKEYDEKIRIIEYIYSSQETIIKDNNLTIKRMLASSFCSYMEKMIKEI